jgi:hypothetical protein
LKKLLKKHHNNWQLYKLEVDLEDLEVDLEDLEVDLEDLEDLEVEVVVKVIDQLEKDVNLLLKYGNQKHC